MGPRKGSIDEVLCGVLAQRRCGCRPPETDLAKREPVEIENSGRRMARFDVTSVHEIGESQSQCGLAGLRPVGPGSADITRADVRSTLTPA